MNPQEAVSGLLGTSMLGQGAWFENWSDNLQRG